MATFIVQINTSSTWILGGRPSVARSSTGRLWCCYLRLIAAVYQVCVSYSDDEGSTWTEEQVTFGVTDQANSAIAVDSADDVHLVWSDAYGIGGGGNIHYCKRTGLGWGAIEDVTSKPYVLPMEEQYLPRLALDSADNVHVVWQGYGWGAFPLSRQWVQYRKRTSGGWQAQESVPEVDMNKGQASQYIAIDSLDNVHVIFSGQGWGANPTKNNVQYRKRTTTWQPQEAVTDVAFHQYAEGIAIDSSDNVCVVFSGFGWGAFPAQRSIQYIKRTAGVWGGQEGVSDKNNEQRESAIALDLDGDVHVLWTGKGYMPNWNRRNIQYRRRTSGGWQARVAVTDRTLDQWTMKLLWANHPTIGGYKPNVPLTGCAGVYSGTIPAYNQIEYYYPSAPIWGALVPLVINKAYALAREEL